MERADRAAPVRQGRDFGHLHGQSRVQRSAYQRRCNSFVSANNTTYPNGYDGLPFGAAPDPRFLTVSQILTSGRSNYDALIVQYRHAFGHGFQGQIGETWSHTPGNVAIYDPLTPQGGYGNLGFDTRHQVAADRLQHAQDEQPVLDLAFTTGRSGIILLPDRQRPSRPQFGDLGQGELGRGHRKFVPRGRDRSERAHRELLGLITGPTPPDGFGVPGDEFADRLRQYRPDQFRGPGYVDLDTQVMRIIPIKERDKFSIGMQFYNLLNHPNFKNPSGSVTSSALGFISSTAVPPTSIYGSFQSGTTSGRVGVLALTLKL